LSLHCYHKEFQGLTLSNLTPWESGISFVKRQEVGNPEALEPQSLRTRRPGLLVGKEGRSPRTEGSFIFISEFYSVMKLCVLGIKQQQKYFVLLGTERKCSINLS
jgi:hypothetical protein